METGADTADIAVKKRNVRRGLNCFNATLLYRSESKKIAHRLSSISACSDVEANITVVVKSCPSVKKFLFAFTGIIGISALGQSHLFSLGDKFRKSNLGNFKAILRRFSNVRRLSLGLIFAS